MTDEHCLMVQGKDSLEVHSDSQLEDSSSSYCYGCFEVQNLNVELASKLEKFVEKHNLLKHQSHLGQGLVEILVSHVH